MVCARNGNNVVSASLAVIRATPKSHITEPDKVAFTFLIFISSH